MAKTLLDINNLRAGIERVSKLTDNIVGVGPLGIGVGGILAWVPVIGPIYSVGAGLVLLATGLRARVPASVLLSSLVLMGLRTSAEMFGDLMPLPPITIASDLGFDLFRAHKWSADMMLKAIDNTHYVEGRHHRDNPAYGEVQARIRSGEERRRVVFLG